MRRPSLVIGATVVVLLAAAVTLGGVTGSASEGGDRSTESFPTETPTSTVDSGSSATTAERDPAFAFTVDRIEECGRTCRDVTSTLTNDGAAEATDVTVYTRIYAGNGTDGDVVWESREGVGPLDAGESYTTTERVELSLADGVAVGNAGGWVTVQTTIQSADRTETVTRRRQVS
jgi:hypothetical protein